MLNADDVPHESWRCLIVTQGSVEVCRGLADDQLGLSPSKFRALPMSRFASPDPHTCNVVMTRFIQFSLAGLFLFIVAAGSGCTQSGNAERSDAATSHDHEGHDHEGHEGEVKTGEATHPNTYSEAVADLLVTHKAIADAFATDDADAAHGPLHDVGHLLEVIEELVKNSGRDDTTQKQLNAAIEQLFASYGDVDEKMHDESQGKDYSDVAKQIENAINTLKAQVTVSKE